VEKPGVQGISTRAEVLAYMAKHPVEFEPVSYAFT
jgi:hypothetical protein